MVTEDRTSWAMAEEVFHAIGAAAVSCQTYSVNHPRVGATLERAITLIVRLFEKDSEASHITFIRNGSQIEFRNVPLANAGHLGERLVKTLKSKGCAGLQLERGITTNDLIGLLGEIGCIRFSAAGETESRAPEAGARASKFHLATQAEVDQIRARGQGGDDAFALLGGAIPELSLVEGTARGLVTAYRGLIANPNQALRLNEGIFAETVDRVLQLLGSHKERLMHGASGEYFDDFTYRHSVNVCIITTMAASSLVKDRETLRRISVAALLHDVGKSQVPEEILHKPGRLTPEEEVVVQLHPTHGAEMLLGADGMDPLCVAIAFGHHKVVGRNPYPKTQRPYECDWITRLVSVVDIYEALTAQRPYKRGMSSDAAFKIMLTMPGMEHQGALVRLVYDTLSPFPIGTLVELSTGERAVVMGLNREAPRLPKVRVLTDQSRQQIEAPLDLDLSDIPASMLGGKPRTVEKAVVRQSADHKALTDDAQPEPTEILGAPLHGNERLMSREG